MNGENGMTIDRRLYMLTLALLCIISCTVGSYIGANLMLWIGK